MKKTASKGFAVLQWIFVVFCLLLCLGMPFGIGTILMLLTAVAALPISPVRNLWDKILPRPKPEEPEGRFGRRKKKAKTYNGLKPLIIALAFIVAISFGVEATKPKPYQHVTDPAAASVSSAEDAGTPASTEAKEPEASSEEDVPASDENGTAVNTEEASANAEETAANDAEAVPPSDPVPPAASSFSVHFIDVGQADAALVECDGHHMLIDGGNKADSNVIYTVLKNAGVNHLDIVVGTHGHEDHIGGIPGAFNYAAADLTLCSVTDYDSDAFDDFARYANEKGGGITVPAVGDEFPLGSATVTILGVNGGSEANDTSIVLKIRYGETSFLFTGDAEREAEQAILNSGADLSATVLKVGHHGSETSTTYPFLREIMPAYAVISVGDDNSYGHPTDDALSRLRDADVEVYRTDLHGDIVFASDGKTVSVSTDKSATAEEILTPGGSVIVEPEPTPEPTPEPEPAPEPAPEPEQPSAGMCWKSATGSKYHSINNCGRMNPNKATRITIEQAESMGLGRCSKCW